MTDIFSQTTDEDLEIEPGRRRALFNPGLTVGLAYAAPVILEPSQASADDGGGDGDGGAGSDDGAGSSGAAIAETSRSNI